MKDDFPSAPATFGGFAAMPAGDGATMLAAAVLCDAQSLAVIASHVARVPVSTPGDGLPALLVALDALPRPPDIAFVDGHGTAEAGRLGLAVRFGAASGLAVVGVATDLPPGMHAGTTLHDMRGAFTPLREEREQVGWVLRSRVGAAPLVVSPGHRIAMPSTPELVMRCIRDHRLPEPLRLALDAL